MNASLEDAIRRLKGRRVIVLGDAMLDHFVHGTVERISPEAPIPVLSIRHEDAMPGGAGNVARNVAALGGEAVLLTVAGNDAEAVQLEAALREVAGIEAILVREPGRPTTLKRRYLAGIQQLLRADRESTAPITSASATRLLDLLDDALNRADALILSDYGKGVLTDEVLRGAIQRASAHGVPVLVDPKRRDVSPYAEADILSPNLAELRTATGEPLHSSEEIVQAARALLSRHRLRWLLVTRGAEGMSLISAQEAHHLPARARSVFDVSGAGDTVIAALALAIAAGVDAPVAAHLANVAGGIVVGKVGTAVVRAEELLEAALEGERPAKHVSRTAAAERVALWRRQGLRVGLTNGCFDLLHQGHVELIAACRRACDRLIVAINSDASVTRLKGPGRPVKDEVERGIILSALADVDLVVAFEEDTPIPLLSELRPDVLLKGGDYTEEQIVGADVVRAYGGSVVRAPFLEGFSTTRTIEKMS